MHTILLCNRDHADAERAPVARHREGKQKYLPDAHAGHLRPCQSRHTHAGDGAIDILRLALALCCISCAALLVQTILLTRDSQREYFSPFRRGNPARRSFSVPLMHCAAAQVVSVMPKLKRLVLPGLVSPQTGRFFSEHQSPQQPENPWSFWSWEDALKLAQRLVRLPSAASPPTLARGCRTSVNHPQPAAHPRRHRRSFSASI